MGQAAELAAPDCNQNLSFAPGCLDCGLRRNDATFAKVSYAGERASAAWPSSLPPRIRVKCGHQHLGCACIVAQ